MFLVLAACGTVAATLPNSPDADTALVRLAADEASYDAAARAVNGAPAGKYTDAERAVVIQHAQNAQAMSRALHTEIDGWKATGTKPADFVANAAALDKEVAAAAAGVKP
jgi:hypothetical protein